MPITKSVKKALKQSRKRRVFNLRRKNKMKELIKQFKELIAKDKKEEAKSLLSKVYKAVDKAAKRGVIKKNTANRRKSRLIKTLK